jgi:hypothetical protein
LTAAAAASSAGQWKLCRSGSDIEIEQVMDTDGEKGVMVRYRRHEPTEMLRQVFWRFWFIQIDAASTGNETTRSEEDTMPDTRTASCNCGAIRIEARSQPVRVGLCHCTTCRKGGGAP